MALQPDVPKITTPPAAVSPAGAAELALSTQRALATIGSRDLFRKDLIVRFVSTTANATASTEDSLDSVTVRQGKAIDLNKALSGIQAFTKDHPNLVDVLTKWEDKKDGKFVFPESTFQEVKRTLGQAVGLTETDPDKLKIRLGQTGQPNTYVVWIEAFRGAREGAGFTMQLGSAGSSDVQISRLHDRSIPKTSSDLRDMIRQNLTPGEKWRIDGAYVPEQAGALAAGPVKLVHETLRGADGAPLVVATALVDSKQGGAVRDLKVISAEALERSEDIALRRVIDGGASPSERSFVKASILGAAGLSRLYADKPIAVVLSSDRTAFDVIDPNTDQKVQTVTVGQLHAATTKRRQE